LISNWVALIWFASALSGAASALIAHGLSAEGWTAIATLFLAGITGGLVYFGFVQASTTRAQLRAYVVPFAWTTAFGAGGAPKAEILLRNTGQTPAYDLVATAGILFAELPIGGFPKMEISGALSRGTLGPQMQIEVRSKESTPLQVAEHDAIMNNKAALYIVGRVEYYDVFRRWQWANFRFEYGQRQAVGQDGSVTVSAEGNDSS
jgi:hypothetical protein